MTGVSGFFDRQGEPSAGRVRFRDTDPRPVEAPSDQFTRPLRDFMQVRPRREPREWGPLDEVGLGALIPTKPPTAKAEDERLIESLADYLAAAIYPGAEGAAGLLAAMIRQWRDGAR